MTVDERERFHALLREGTNLLRQRRATDAMPLLEEAHRLDPAVADAALNLSGAYIMVGQFKKAVPILEELREQEPDNAMVWTNLGAAYLGNPILATSEQQTRAITAFKQALALDPSAPSVAYNLGLIYRDRQEWENARRWFKRAVRTNPRDQHARSLLKRLESDEN